MGVEIQNDPTGTDQSFRKTERLFSSSSSSNSSPSPDGYDDHSDEPSLEIHFHSHDSSPLSTASSHLSRSSSSMSPTTPSMAIRFTSRRNHANSSPPSPPLDDPARIIALPFHSGNGSTSTRAASGDAGRWMTETENREPAADERVVERLVSHVDGRRVAWREVEERFDQLAFVAGPDRVPVVEESSFAYCIGMAGTPDFAEELLRAMRGGGDGGGIAKDELRDLWRRVHDPRWNMGVGEEATEKEMKQVILLSASANKLSISHQEAEDYARLITEELLGVRQETLDAHQRATANTGALFHDGSLAREATGGGRRLPPSSLEVFARANWRRAWVVLLWLAACSSLFAWKFVQYRYRSAFEVMGYCLCTAKGAAETLKLNMALVLLPVCRNTVTWLRKHRWLNSVLPFNDNLNFHKIVAGGIVVGVILHGGTHLACDFPRIAGADRSLFRQTIAADFQHRQPTYVDILATTEGATGIGMVILMAVAFALATKRPRREPASLPRSLRRFAGFNTFWYSHHLFVVVYVLLIVHSMFLFLTKSVLQKTTWMYVAFPILLYVGERVIRTIRAELYDVKVIRAITYPGKVLSLKVHKPATFRYRSGMYIFVQCPQVSSFEWHPFSLTSAPDDDHLSLHVRVLGDWSYQVYSLFQEALVSGEWSFPKMRIDGPYGSAAQDYVKYDITVLIGLGIGATPFISILKNIVHGCRPAPDELVDEEVAHRKGPTKAYFYWVTREQGSFDWFRDIMKDISAISKRQAVIEMHNYLTSIYKDDDTRSTLISAVQALHYMKTGVDIFSRTKVRTHFARPNWYRVFSGLANRHQGERIGVFYCGPQVLARELQGLCNKMTEKTSTRFVFHKENY